MQNLNWSPSAPDLVKGRGLFNCEGGMSWKDHLKEFVKECLLFQSNEIINWLYGLLAWASFCLFITATGNLISSYW
jgi:hypothetical protein